MPINNMITIHNVETGEVIERQMTSEELEKQEQDKAIYQDMLNKAEAKAANRAALLNRLGITEDEARLLLG